MPLVARCQPNIRSLARTRSGENQELEVVLSKSGRLARTIFARRISTKETSVFRSLEDPRNYEAADRAYYEGP